ncbi:hypothetical protein QNM99_09720 [Pseudomonas sp. PCH446]
MRHWIVFTALLISFSAQAGIIDVNRAVDEIRDGALILDLRNNADFAAGNVHNSLQVDLTLEDGTGNDARAWPTSCARWCSTPVPRWSSIATPTSTPSMPKTR